MGSARLKFLIISCKCRSCISLPLRTSNCDNVFPSLAGLLSIKTPLCSRYNQVLNQCWFKYAERLPDQPLASNGQHEGDRGGSNWSTGWRRGREGLRGCHWGFQGGKVDARVGHTEFTQRCEDCSFTCSCSSSDDPIQYVLILSHSVLPRWNEILSKETSPNLDCIQAEGGARKLELLETTCYL